MCPPSCGLAADAQARLEVIYRKPITRPNHNPAPINQSGAVSSVGADMGYRVHYIVIAFEISLLMWCGIIWLLSSGLR
jgi:hypothetical protein